MKAGTLLAHYHRSPVKFSGGQNALYVNAAEMRGQLAVS